MPYRLLNVPQRPPNPARLADGSGPENGPGEGDVKRMAFAVPAGPAHAASAFRDVAGATARFASTQCNDCGWRQWPASSEVTTTPAP
jgi:hypothetical protein